MKHFAFAFLLTGLLIVGCGNKNPAVGTERGACYGNGTCNEGLLCTSDLCVRPPPPDCHKVAMKLSYTALSNYAPKEERDAYVSRMVTTCKQAALTHDEADCILASKNRSELGRCPKPMALGSCKRVLDKVSRLLASDSAAVSDMLDPGPALRECERTGITREQEDCVMRASTKEQLKSCGSF